MGGRHTTILDGVGQYDHERPETVIVSAPPGALKVDVSGPDAFTTATVSLCLRPEFFPKNLGMSIDGLPEPLRSLCLDRERPTLCRSALTPDLMSATRSVLSAPVGMRRQAVYSRAKAVELMCLLIDQMESERGPRRIQSIHLRRKESRVRAAREVISRRYAEVLTLEDISREVGLNRVSLTSGFRQLFGLSVHDCIQRERMQYAYRLLEDGARTVEQVAHTVGYSHSSTFSTAFRSFFGCSPQKVRRGVTKSG
jgi:AraC-like DNA-binding protein